MNVAEFKDNLSAMLHGGTLNKVRNLGGAMQRAATTMLSQIDPIDTERTTGLSNSVHDNLFNYSLPSDFKKIIDLYPQSRRTTHDTANRVLAEKFDLRKALSDKTISIEGSEGDKILRVSWKTRQPKTLNELNTVTSNGTWGAVNGATNIKSDSIDYVSGSGSLKFDVVTNGDGVQNSTMSAVDLTDEDEVGDITVWFKIKNATDLAKISQITLSWGSSVSNYWTNSQSEQADGTAFRVGWNQVLLPWSTATETGTVNPAAITYIKFVPTVSGAIEQIRLDNIMCSIGKSFDVKYYSKYIIKNSSGTWINKTTSDDDVIILDNDALQIYLLETFIQCAHQIEGSDSTYDITFAKNELGQVAKNGLYAKYAREYPSQSKKPASSYGTITTHRHFR